MEISNEVITLHFNPQVFWGLVSVLVFGSVVGLTLAMVKLLDPEGNWLAQLKENLGLKGFNTALYLIALLVWGAIFLLLLLGVIWLIWELISSGPPDPDGDLWKLRFELVKLTALTATLGAVVALPITMQRLHLTRQQTEMTRQQTNTAEEALFNDKINVAADDLHARRLVTNNPNDKEAKNRWDYHQDDIVKRNAAIDRLEGLAIERPDIAPRIARMLSIYVRELTSEHPPLKPQENSSPDDLRTWAQDLKACRSDMENAVQTLGRLQGIDGVSREKIEIDLRGANLQGFDLQGASLLNARLSGAKMQGAILIEAEMQGADLSEAEMQGADLSGAKMQGADLSWAKMQGANLIRAEMQGADLSGAEMQGAILRWSKMQGAILIEAKVQGANLIRAEMQGADLSGAEMQGAILRWSKMQGAILIEAEMDSATVFKAAMPQGAALKTVDCTGVQLEQAQVDVMFGDGSVTLPSGLTRPEDWPPEDLEWRDFVHQWRAWQKQRGYEVE